MLLDYLDLINSPVVCEENTYVVSLVCVCTYTNVWWRSIVRIKTSEVAYVPNRRLWSLLAIDTIINCGY